MQETPKNIFKIYTKSFLVRRTLKQIIITIIFSLSLTACAARVPVPEGTIPKAKLTTAQDMHQGAQVKQALVKQFGEDSDPQKLERVTRIVKRLALAAGGYALAYPWNITILADSTVKNAAATKGNYVFVWNGMLLALKDDHELAAVLGHEIAHVLATHTDPTFAEQLREAAASGAGIIASNALATQGMIAADRMGSLTSTVFRGFLVNPYSQKLELEADQIGLFLMAKAGYNPESSIALWRRLSNDPDFSSSLNFLSTHPSSTKRADELQRLLPRAQELYKQSKTDSFKVGGKNNKPTTPEKLNPTQPIAPTSAPTNLKIENTSNATTSLGLQNKINPKDQKITETKSKSSLDLWTIKVDSASVYAAADKNSVIKVTLKRDEKVLISHNLKDWIEISEPVGGFIQKEDVKAPWSKK